MNNKETNTVASENLDENGNAAEFAAGEYRDGIGTDNEIHYDPNSVGEISTSELKAIEDMIKNGFDNGINIEAIQAEANQMLGDILEKQGIDPSGVDIDGDLVVKLSSEDGKSHMRAITIGVEDFGTMVDGQLIPVENQVEQAAEEEVESISIEDVKALVLEKVSEIEATYDSKNDSRGTIDSVLNRIIEDMPRRMGLVANAPGDELQARINTFSDEYVGHLAGVISLDIRRAKKNLESLSGLTPPEQGLEGGPDTGSELARIEQMVASLSEELRDDETSLNRNRLEVNNIYNVLTDARYGNMRSIREDLPRIIQALADQAEPRALRREAIMNLVKQIKDYVGEAGEQ